MDISIKGIEKLSVIDYPEKTCAIVFLAGCNFRCPYCQNPDLIKRPDKLESISEEEVLDFLRSRKKWLDGLCLTGGEPCLQIGLPNFIRRVKKEGFLVKLDTNGSNPDMLEKLVSEKLLDYIAMDIKSSLERYEEVVMVRVSRKDIKRSADIIMNSGVEYEFRTTVIPEFHRKEDIIKIGEWLKGAERYYIQNFKSGLTLNPSFKNKPSFSENELNGFAEIARKHFNHVGVRSS